MASIRRTRAFCLENFIGVFLAVLVLFGSIYGIQGVTVSATHCKMAPVQSVTVSVVSRQMSGDVIESKFTRAPRPGEPGFKLCQCSKKADAPSAPATETKSSQFDLVAVVPDEASLSVSWSIAASRGEFSAPVRHRTTHRPDPATPPPRIV